MVLPKRNVLDKREIDSLLSADMASLIENERRVFARSANKVIESAESVTFLRALLAQEREEAGRNPDHLAKHFLSPPLRLLCKAFPLAKRLAEWRAPGAAGYHLARTKHIDSIILGALSQGVDQLVILGAGNDSRPYRFKDQLGGARVFEVDYPGTQGRKKAQLKKAFGTLPDHVTFVAIDFNKQPLYQTLAAAGYDSSRRTFFNWEGVSCYLTEQAVDGVLSFVAKHAARGSEIVFDYCLRSFIDGDHSTFGACELAHWMDRVGEPYIFGLNADQLEPFVQARGLAVVSDIGAAELEQRYMRRSDGSLYARSYGMLRVAHARSV